MWLFSPSSSSAAISDAILCCCNARDRGSGFGRMTPLSRSLVGKARGCDIDFLRCSFRPLIPVTIIRGRNAISENRVAHRLFRAFRQARTVLRGHEHPKKRKFAARLRGWRTGSRLGHVMEERVTCFARRRTFIATESQASA